MIISAERSFVFVHVPKNGGRRFRELITPYHDNPEIFWTLKSDNYLGIELDYAHLRTWEIKAFFPSIWDRLQTVQSLCFFRNPVHRFVSAIYEHFRQYREEGELANYEGVYQLRLARELANDVLDVKRVYNEPRLVHFCPQTWFTHLNDHQVVRDIVPLIDGFDALRAAAVMLRLPDPGPNCLPADKRDPLALLGRELVDRVEQFYRADYAFCRAQDHLCSLTAT